MRRSSCRRRPASRSRSPAKGRYETLAMRSPPLDRGASLLRRPLVSAPGVYTTRRGANVAFGALAGCGCGHTGPLKRRERRCHGLLYAGAALWCDKCQVQRRLPSFPPPASATCARTSGAASASSGSRRRTRTSVRPARSTALYPYEGHAPGAISSAEGQLRVLCLSGAVRALRKRTNSGRG
jgi:hypothetical protein